MEIGTHLHRSRFSKLLLTVSCLDPAAAHAQYPILIRECVNLWSGSGSVASVLLDAQAHFKVIRLADGSFALQTVDGFHYLTADDGGGLDSTNSR
jgi:hypothetical protein